MDEKASDSIVKRITLSSVFPFLFFPLYFLYVRYRIDPGLTYQEQESVFFWGTSFLRRFFGVPGGLTEYLSSLLSLFFINSWAGALIVACIAAAVTLAASKAVRNPEGPPGTRFRDYLPAVFLLMLHSHYKHPLAVSMGYLFALVFFGATVAWVPRKTAIQLASLALLIPALYWLAGGPFFLFAALWAVYALFLERGSLLRRAGTALFCVGMAAAVPYVFRETLFMVTLKGAYTALLPFQQTYKPGPAPYLLYAFPIFLVWFEAFGRRRKGVKGEPVRDRPSGRKRKDAPAMLAVILSKRKPWAQAAGAVLVLLTAGVAAFVSFDPVNHAILQVDFYARRGMWPQVLMSAKNETSEYGLVAYHVNRALCHLRLLPEKMFAVPQRLGINGLFFPKRFQYLIPLQVSDLFFEMGHVNEAQHWAHEAVSQKGETPWNLRRLAQTYLLRNEKEAASEYIALLRRTPLQRKWAERMERLCGSDSLLAADAEMRRLRSLMPDLDFVINSEEPYLDLDAMLSENRENRMAFEYMMASYLLKGKVGKFANRIGRLKDFQYSAIPKSYNEALMLYYVEKKRLPAGLSDAVMDQKTVQRYADFYRILSRYRWNRLSAMGELQRSHFDTYWYYVFYFKPAADREADPESPLADGIRK